MTKIPTEILELAIQGGWQKEILARPLAKYKIDTLGSRNGGKIIGIWFYWAQRSPTNQAIQQNSTEFLEFEIALDREFWIALGKKLGWGDVPPVPPMWQFHAMSFYDLILSGQDLTEFWNGIYQANT